MICEVCGDDCRCGAWAPESDELDGYADAEDLSEQSFQASLETETPLEAAPKADGVKLEEPLEVASSTEPAAEKVDSEVWRGEVAARLERYRARRKPRPPRYPSLWLEFDTPEATSRSASRESVARDEFAETAPVASAAAASTEEPPVPAKILAFPRSSAAPPVPVYELADPVPSQPRILEVAETPAQPPALGGITINAPSEDGRRNEEHFGVTPASVPRRLAAALADAFVVGVACALAGAVFWQIVRVRPPVVQLAGICVVTAAGLWALYQYLLIVYSGRTPGLWLAGLELTCLNGSVVTRSRRRWRVLASFLSLASLGLGYVWALIEADRLAWHDRMTGTCMAVRPSRSRG